ncbi:MAG: thermonuclease family protein [Xenococcaceae cyanobacterium]
MIQSSKKVKIRFACIDTLEKNKEGGIEARNYLRSLLALAGDRVYVEFTGEDIRNNRAVAQLWIDFGSGKELVQQLEVNAGMAWAYEQYKNDCSQWNAIAAGMKQAKAKKLGIWRGNPQPPWDWRKAHKNK